MILQSIGQIDLRCSNKNSGSRILCLKNVLYISKAGINLISQGQIYQEHLYLLSIINNRICIGNKSIFVHLVKNNFYIIDIASLSDFTFSFINKKTLKT